MIEAAGRQLTSDSGGSAEFETTAATTEVRITHGGYLERLSVVQAGSPVAMLLWPRSSTSGMNEQLIGELVYTSTGTGPDRGAPLRRLRDNQVTIELSAALLTNSAVVQAHERAVNLMNQATEGRVIYRLGTCGNSICVRVTSGTTTAQGESRTQVNSQGYITGGEILYRDDERAAQFDIALHEMGHIYGLQHGSGNIVMCGSVAGVGTCQGPLPIALLGQFTAREQLIMKLMLLRPAGTRFPDDDRSGTTSPGTLRFLDSF